MPVARHATPSASELRALIQADRPFVATGLLDAWPAREWTLDSMASEYAALPTCLRLHRAKAAGPAAGAAAGSSSSVAASSDEPFGSSASSTAAAQQRVPFEGECSYCSVTLGEFCHWLKAASLPSGSPLANFPAGEFIGYCDYQDMPALFADAPGALAAVDWSHILAAADDDQRRSAPSDGSRSTLWLGSAGASTPTHYDSYGVNLVAQLSGTKRWRLWPPTNASAIASAAMRPSRVPYEESSVFCDDDDDDDDDDDFGSGDDAVVRSAPCGSEGAGAHAPNAPADECWRVDLAAGELLYVPRHWWHRVVTTSPHALSINMWLDASEDCSERVKEAAVRLVAGSLIRAAQRATVVCDAADARGSGGSGVQGSMPAEVMATDGIEPAAEESLSDGATPPFGREPACGWVNPTEDLSADVQADLELLAAALRQEDEAAMAAAAAAAAAASSVDAPDGQEAMACVEITDGDEGQAPAALAGLGAVAVARGLCIGKPLEAAASALHRRLVGSGAGGSGGGGGGGGGGGEQLRAPLARLLRCALLESSIGSSSAQPKAQPFVEAFVRLQASARGHTREIRLADVINATCTGHALDEIVQTLGRGYRAQLQRARTLQRSKGKRDRDPDGAASSAECQHPTGACDCDPSCVVS